MFIRGSKQSGFALGVELVLLWLLALGIAIGSIWVFVDVYTQVGGDWAADIETSSRRMPLPLFVWAGGCLVAFLFSVTALLAPIWLPLWLRASDRRKPPSTLSAKFAKWKV